LSVESAKCLRLEGTFLEHWRLRHLHIALSALPIHSRIIPGPLARAITSRAFGASDTRPNWLMSQVCLLPSRGRSLLPMSVSLGLRL